MSQKYLKSWILKRKSWGGVPKTLLQASCVLLYMSANVHEIVQYMKTGILS